jgi:hypothetical protein
MSGRDLGASVRPTTAQPISNSREAIPGINPVLRNGAILYRPAKSSFADRFVLKGALLLSAWRSPLSRPTMDIDLAGRSSNELEHFAPCGLNLSQRGRKPWASGGPDTHTQT